MYYSDLKKLKAYFLALKETNYHPKLIPNSIEMGGARIPIDKTRCLELLHSFPSLEGKNDNQIFDVLSDPKKVKSILDQLPSPSERNELREVLKEKPVATEGVSQQAGSQEIPAEQTTAGESAGTMDGESHGGGMPHFPSGFSGFSGRPAIHNIPRAPSEPEIPKSKVVIANKSGVVAEAPPKSFVITDKSGNIVGERSIGPGPATQGLATETSPSKLVLARSDGSIIEKAASPKKIPIADSRGNIIREHTIPTQGRFNFSAFRSKAGRGIASAARAGLETANPFLKRAGIGLLNGLESIAKPGGIGRMGGGSRSIFGKFGRFRGGGGGGSLITKAKSRGWLMFSIGILGFMMLVGGLAIIGANQTGTPPGGNVGIGTATPSAGIQPPPAAPITDPSELRQAIIEKFGITMNGYDGDHLRWAWEKLWDVSTTNFPKYIKGVTITKSKDTRKVNCSTLQIDQYPEELFKLTLMHEFGHIIQDCDQGLPRQLAEHQNAYAKEGGVTYYANHAVACGSYYDIQEDFAEMIAYYLNPNTNIPTARCTPSGFTNPRIKQKFPLHYNVVRAILGGY